MKPFALPAAALAAVALLVGAYLALGGGHYEARRPVDPCAPQRWHAPHGTDDLTNELVLSTLDGAACQLHVSRASLALALSSAAARERFRLAHHLDSGSIGDAIRAGLVRAIGDAEDAGVVNGIEAFLLRQIAENLPSDQLLALARQLSGLLG